MAGLGIAAIIIAAVGAVASSEQQKSAAFEQRKANEVRNRLTQIRSQRERSRTVRERIQAQAQVQAQQATAGTQSSAAQGVISSVGSQAASNLSFLQTSQDFQSNIFSREQAAGRATTRANIFSTLGQAGSTVFGQAGNI